MEKVAVSCMSNAAYLKNELKKAGFEPVHDKLFFNEFVTECPAEATALAEKLESKGILTGLPIEENRILWCATEKNTKEEMDDMVSALKEVLEGWN